MTAFVQAVAAIFVVAALFSLQNKAEADDDGSRCREIAAKIITATGARFSRTEGPNVFLKHKDVKELSLNCSMSFSVGASLDSPYPPNEFFDFFAEAAALTGNVAKAQIEKAARDCHQDALKKGSGSYVDIGSSQVSCGVGLRSSSAYFSFFPN